MSTINIPCLTSQFMRRPFASRVFRCASLAAVVASSLLSSADLNGQDEPIPFNEDFQSYSPGSTPTDPWTTAVAGGQILVVNDSEDLFGKGSENQILDYNKSVGDGVQALYASDKFAVEVGRISFDFIQPDDGAEGLLWVLLHVGPRRSGTQDYRAAYFDIGDGIISRTESYQRGALNHVEIFFNNGDDTILYGDGNILAPGTLDFWVNGELTEAGASRQNNARGPINSIEFNSAGSRVHRFLFDDIQIEPIEFQIPPPDEAPEPQVIFYEDFASHTAGEIPGAPWTTITVDPLKTGSALIQKDSADLFGKGSDNQYMDYIANGDGAIVARSQDSFSSDLITFSVRLITPTPDGTPGYSWFIFNAGPASGTGNRVQVITLDNRESESFPEGGSRIASQEYPQNVPVQIDLVINNKLVPVEYGNGYVVESGKTDIWIDGVLARAGFVSQNNKLGPVTTFELNVSGSARQHLLIDEITIYDSARISDAPGSGGFADWRGVHFPDDAENDEVSGPAANPTGDGVPNLLKYALGLDPTVASREGLPTTETREIEGVEYLTISFKRPADRDDVTYSVVATSNLSGWTDQAVLADTIDNVDGTVTEIWRDSQPLASSGARFLRLEVSLQ